MMSLVTTKQMFQQAQQHGYGIAGFAAYDSSTIRALIETADSLQAPVLIQCTPSNIDNMGVEYLASIATVAARSVKVPVALHLDHGDTLDRVANCLRHGFTSVMIDGSALPYGENVALVKQAVQMAHWFGVPVEAELGRVGGVEDDVAVSDKEAYYTDPAQADDFVRRTGVDSLAVAIGTAHGWYHGEPQLDYQRLLEIRERVNVPLVLHGASGVPDVSIREVIRLGIVKINIATELKMPYAGELRRYLLDNPSEADPRKMFKTALKAYASVVRNKIELVGAVGRG